MATRDRTYPRLKAPSAIACIAGVEIPNISAFLDARLEERSPLAPFRPVMIPMTPKTIEGKDGILILCEKMLYGD